LRRLAAREGSQTVHHPAGFAGCGFGLREAAAEELRKEAGQLHLRVRDNGIGFDVGAVREQAMRGASLGLLSMEERAALALRIDQAIRENAPAGWKGDDIREKQVLNALFPIMYRDRQSTQAIFEIIKNQPGY